MSAQWAGYAQTPFEFYGWLILECLDVLYDGYIEGLVYIQRDLDFNDEDFDLGMEWLETFVYPEFLPDDRVN